jgi:SAM-dependent methyltransferase
MGLYQTQKKYFEKAYETGEHGWPAVGPTPFVLRALRLIRRGAAAAGRGRILDLGCGEGRHTLACAREGFKVVGLDYQPLAIRRARDFARRQKVRGDFEFRVGDAFRLPFPPDSFDGIIDYGCLHHVKIGDTRRYLDSVLPRLRPGGYFILSCFSTRFKHHPGEKRTRNWLVHKGHYDRFFRKQDFKTLFGKRFDILKMEEEADGLSVFWHVLMRKK